MAQDVALTYHPLAEFRPRDQPQSPPAVRLLLAICAVGFIIYVPVALFRTTAPLLLLDLALLGVVLLTLGAAKPRRLLGGSAAIWTCVAIYLLSVIPALFIDRPVSSASTLQGLRSSLFGVVTLVVASAWLDTTERADRFLRIFMYGAVFVALYAIRQIAFGLLPFEVERLSFMGNSAGEIDVLDRIRIPSAFGDPATFAFFGMLGICLYLVARRRDALPSIMRRVPWLVLLLMVIGLASTLTRAPMLGVFGAVFFLILTSQRLGWRWILRLSLIAFTGLMGILLLDYIVTQNVFADSSIGWVRSVHNALASAWTLVPSALTGDVGRQLENLRIGSASARSDAWAEGIRYLLDHPLGGGIGAMTEGGLNVITFSPIDVGILRFGLELGWTGMLSMAALWACVFLTGFRHWLRATDPRTRSLARGLLATWVAIGLAQSVTSFLHTELIAAVSWMIAAMLINIDRIGNSEHVRQAMQHSGVKQ